MLLARCRGVFAPVAVLPIQYDGPEVNEVCLGGEFRCSGSLAVPHFSCTPLLPLLLRVHSAWRNLGESERVTAQVPTASFATTAAVGAAAMSAAFLRRSINAGPSPSGKSAAR